MVSNTLEGASQVVVLPTGSGKSLCFQLAGLLLDGPTLVLLPLLSLLADQLRRLREAGVPVAELRGGQEPAERERLFASVAAGEVRIVLATPEACLVEATLRRLAALRFRHLVVDEAHCIAEWGAFRPAYLALGELARAIGAPVVTAFTATASEPVVRRIREVLLLGDEARVVAGDPDRPNIRYAVLPVLAREREIERMAREKPRPLLVFCRTRDGTEVFARETRRRLAGRSAAGGEVLFYHAGLAREERAAVERRFLASGDAILFATSAYGMGVDKSDIRTVVHADVPPSVEAYLQETGRAGRDGKPTDAVLFVSREDGRFRDALASGRDRDRLDRMIAYARASDACRRRSLAELIGQQPNDCGGCDVCDGTSAAAAPGEREILRFVAAHPRRFPLERAAEALAGRSTPRTERGFLDGVRGFGGLDGWERPDIEEAIRELVVLGRLRVAGWPWQGALAPLAPAD